MKHVSIYNDGRKFVVTISENGMVIYTDEVNSLDIVTYLQEEKDA